MTASSSSVRVAVRIRPLTENEKQHCQHNAIAFIPDNQQQIIVGGDRPFTFDYVYPPTSSQQDVYNSCVIPLLNKFLKGYNSTILAYGQTGSGKTYSMGIGLDSVMNASANDGIVPRFIDSLFSSLESKRSPNYSFQVCVSFLELHNEDLVDLLCPNVRSRREGLNLTIREDSHGNICWSGVREEGVSNTAELMGLLRKGSIARTTASTDMNSTSSRSHAIFSIILRQFQVASADETLVENTTLSDQTNASSSAATQQQQTKRLVSKFHFVDLAGSERLKRTNAVGDRAKEGISINTGLLALGNVISALGDESRRVSHIPYRDSKLTRLLQDSLGGNSQTLMLACASPADANMTETLNTLKYANRARNIRNRVVINQEIGESDRLKATITRLKEELRGTDDFLRAVNDEMDSLKSQVGSLHHTLDQTTFELASVKYERDAYKHQLSASGGGQQPFVQETLVQEYAHTIESLRGELLLQSQQLLLLKQQSAAAAAVVGHATSLQIDHVDSSATLVGSTHSYTTPQSPLLVGNKESPSEKTSRKKKHSYRFGSKRAKSIRRRSISSLTLSSSNTASPKQIRGAVVVDVLTQQSLDELNENLILQEAKKSMQSETEFLQSAKISIAHQNNASWELKSNDMGPNPRSLQYRRRTVDIIPPTIPVAAVLQNDYLSENKRLLQKLSSAIESKHLLIRQLEKCEKLRVDQVKQLNRKLQDTTAKKTTAASQYKRELAELRNQYECRIKKQQVEQQTLRRKHMQLISKSDTMRNQNQSVIDQLNRNMEKLTHEKKKLIKRLKLESDRAREKALENGKEMSKMKRQEAQLVSARKRLERELLQQKSASKRATEEIVALNGQMKQIAAILKKVLSNQGKKAPAAAGNSSAVTDCNLLAKAAACANVRGYLVKQNAVKKVGGKFKVTSLQQQVYQKKKLIHRAISLHVRNQSSAKVSEELIQKRDRLREEQKELLAERQLVLEEERKSGIESPLNEPQYMDERIDLITLQVDTLNQQISHILDQKHAEDDDELDEKNWMDIIDKDLQIDLFGPTKDSQVAYEIALSLIRSMQPEEARLVSESLLEDIIVLKTDQLTSSTLVRHLNNMLYSLQTGLVQMRRAVIPPLLPTRRQLPSSRIAMATTTSTTPNTIKTAGMLTPLDSVFIKVLSSPVDIRSGLVLPK